MRRLLAPARRSSLLVARAAAAPRASSLVDVPLSGAADRRDARARSGSTSPTTSTARRAACSCTPTPSARGWPAAGFPSATLVADVEAEHLPAARADRAAAAPAARSRAAERPRHATASSTTTTASWTRSPTRTPGLVRARRRCRAQSVEGRDARRRRDRRATSTATDDGRPVYVVMGCTTRASGRPARSTWSSRSTSRAATAATRASRACSTACGSSSFPVINPDGFVVSRGDRRGRPGGADRCSANCRRRPAERKPCAQRDGVDLNRNYGAGWGGTGASTDPASDTYRGPGPWSEPETQAVHEFSQRLHDHELPVDPQHRRARAAPAGLPALGPGARRGAPEGARRPDGRGDRLRRRSTATSSTRSPARPRTGTTSRRARSATRSSSGRRATRRLPGPVPDARRRPVPRRRPRRRPAGKGVREALLLAAEQAADARDHAVLAASRRPGAAAAAQDVHRRRRAAICQPTATTGGSTATARSPTAPQLLDDGLDTS